MLVFLLLYLKPNKMTERKVGNLLLALAEDTMFTHPSVKPQLDAVGVLLDHEIASKFFPKILVGKEKMTMYGNPIVMSSKSQKLNRDLSTIITNYNKVLELASDQSIQNEIVAFTSVWLFLNGITQQYLTGRNGDNHALYLSTVLQIAHWLHYFETTSDDQAFELLMDSLIDAVGAIVSQKMYVNLSATDILYASELNEDLKKMASRNARFEQPTLPLAPVLASLSKGELPRDVLPVEDNWGYPKTTPRSVYELTPSSSEQTYQLPSSYIAPLPGSPTSSYTSLIPGYSPSAAYTSLIPAAGADMLL